MLTKKIQLTFFAFLYYSLSMACTFTPNDFCRTYINSPGNPTAFGKIIAIDEFGIDLELIEMLRGEESNSVIRIWSGTDFDCNGPWSMAASDIGELNDTVIIILNDIIEVENDWDVVGDYRRRNPYNATTELTVEDGIVKGFLSGDIIAPPSYNLWQLEYDLFREQLEDNSCPLTVNTEDFNLELNLTLNNPFSAELRIQTDQAINRGLLKIYDITGQVVHVQAIENENEISINTFDFYSGIYFIELRNESKRLKLIKALKI